MTLFYPMCPPPSGNGVQLLAAGVTSATAEGVLAAPIGAPAQPDSVVNHALIPTATADRTSGTTGAPSASAEPHHRVSRRVAMSTAVATLATAYTISSPSIAAAALHQVGADERLLQLGREFDVAFERETAAYAADDGHAAEVAAGHTAKIARQIVSEPARTIAGLMVKARAASWCRCGEISEEEIDAEEAATDTRLCFSIVRDLLALSAA